MHCCDKTSAIHTVSVVAAPTALQAHNVCIGKSLTSYPTFREQLQEKYTYKEDNVVVDGWYTFASDYYFQMIHNNIHTRRALG
jgi:putative intracellular protease/amidase